MRISCAVPAAFFLMVSSGASFALVCTIAPDGKSVSVKVSNPYPKETYCTVNCHFKVSGGMTSVSCTKTVPASAVDFVLCQRAIDEPYGKLDSGNEECVKPL
jgi:hypothetical protein